MYFENTLLDGFQGTNPDAMFQDHTNVMFIQSEAIEDGAVYISPLSSTIVFTGLVNVRFCGNVTSLSGGAISSLTSNIWLTGSCTVYFNNNWSRQHGGAMHIAETGSIKFAEGSTVEFYNNTALLSGGALSSLERRIII